MGVIGNLMFAVGFKVGDSALKKVDKQMTGLKDNWTKVGIATAAVGTAIIGVGVAALSASSDFNKSMASIQMATGQTADQMEATKDVAKNLYKQNFGENWQLLSDAIAVTTQITQQHGKELENTTRNALLFQEAFKKDIPESIKTTDTMMRQFGITSDDSFNLLAQGQQKGLDKSGELLDTANEYANQFKALGFSADEMFDTLAAGSENGAFNLDKVGYTAHYKLLYLLGRLMLILNQIICKRICLI
ncbi:hypothetical protein BVG16_13770 [Paenibacillus selenitireducens]|uniref:Phage tail tape measure protein domain-containing protein n=1 Tax=Paenibacillus selenitireducens TaxID=1324314 RepID=A0A1T2XCF8_9BACL|nr:phage tail tape measure protein [Paenibacillus selenitireducens]OPA77515.1 hypothetical protein BVG16_13770 [Paenibacillus selenitireducens]